MFLLILRFIDPIKFKTKKIINQVYQKIIFYISSGNTFVIGRCVFIVIVFRDSSWRILFANSSERFIEVKSFGKTQTRFVHVNIVGKSRFKAFKFKKAREATWYG